MNKKYCRLFMLKYREAMEHYGLTDIKLEIKGFDVTVTLCGSNIRSKQFYDVTVMNEYKEEDYMNVLTHAFTMFEEQLRA